MTTQQEIGQLIQKIKERNIIPENTALTQVLDPFLEA